VRFVYDIVIPEAKNPEIFDFTGFFSYLESRSKKYKDILLK